MMQWVQSTLDLMPLAAPSFLLLIGHGAAAHMWASAANNMQEMQVCLCLCTFYFTAGLATFLHTGPAGIILPQFTLHFMHLLHHCSIQA